MLEKKYKPEAFVFFIDNDDSYIRDVLAKFEEVNEHNVKIYSRSKEFFKDFDQLENKKRRIYIVFLSANLEIGENNKEVNPIDVIKRIKRVNAQTEVILYSEKDDIDLISEAFNCGVYTFIKRNENIILRIENNIKGIISQKIFLLKKSSSRLLTLFFIAFLFLTSLAALAMYFIYPELFAF